MPIRPLATCTVWIAVDDATPETAACASFRGRTIEDLAEHAVNNDPNYTLNQELDPATYDPADAIDVIFEAGQISLHDVFVPWLGGECSTRPRRGMTLRLMPTSSVYDRAMAAEIHATKGGYNQAKRTIFLMRGADRSGGNDFAQPAIGRRRSVVGEDHVGGFLGDHDGRCVGAAGQARHDRGVDHPQTVNAMHSQARIDHRQRVGSHLAGADRMVKGGAAAGGKIGEGGVIAQIGARGDFERAMAGQAGASKIRRLCS